MNSALVFLCVVLLSVLRLSLAGCYWTGCSLGGCPAGTTKIDQKFCGLADNENCCEDPCTSAPSPRPHITFPGCGRTESGYSCEGRCTPGYTPKTSIIASCYRATWTYSGECTEAPCAAPSPADSLHMAFPACDRLS
eukprot:EG_transcript_46628